MKAKSILLSTIILGGFITPILNNTIVDAADIQTTIVPKKAKQDSTGNNQVARKEKVNLTDKITTDKLNDQTTIVIPSSTNKADNKLDDIFVNLENDQLQQLKAGATIDLKPTDLEVKTSFGGTLTYSSEDMKLKYDQTNNKLVLMKADDQPTDHLIYKLINGDVSIHYVYKDTKEEIFQNTQKDALELDSYVNDSNSFRVEELEDIDDAPDPIGHFDAVNIDFNNLDPDTPTTPGFHEKSIDIDFDRDSINKDNVEYTVLLEKAKPVTIDFIVYLDGEVYSEQKVTGELNSYFPKDVEEKLPDKKNAKLNINKSKISVSNEYFPQTGTTSLSGKDFHQTLFDWEQPKPRESGFLQKAIYYVSANNSTSEESQKIKMERVGGVHQFELHYESINKDVTADLEINSNLGKQTVKGVQGKRGETITVQVPQIKGYKTNKQTVQAKVHSDGTITTEDFIFYMKINDGNNNDNGTDGNENGGNKPGTGDNNGNGNDGNKPGTGDNNGNGNDGNKPGTGDNNGNGNDGNKPGTGDNNGNGSIKPPVVVPVPQPEKFQGFVGTKKNDVKLYKITDGKISDVTNRALAKHSDWIANGVIKIDGAKYYRVATNEWVKASDIYRYEVESGIVDTKNIEMTTLVTSSASQVTNRALAANTSWKYDRIAYLGDKEEKHYRVATHEFVHEQHVDKK